MGIVLIITGIGIGSGAVTTINREVSERITFTSTPIKALEERALDGERSSGMARAAQIESGNGAGVTPTREVLEIEGYPEHEGRRVGQGPAPQLAGIEKWFNTAGGKPLSLDKLRGKVVLVDFWTYSCINCIRTVPHLRDLHEKYKDRGLVIIGVHTPEFAFERDHSNIKKAIADLDVRWPVAVDNEYSTWKKYYNRYWPAHYLIDADGNIQQVHYGEGAYSETSDIVGELLDERDAKMSEQEKAATAKTVVAASGAGKPSGESAELRTLADPDVNNPRTRETYLGYARAERFVGSASGVTGFAQDVEASYVAGGESLNDDEWSLTGRWTVRDEQAVAGSDAKLKIAYQARDVYLVLGPEAGTTRRTAPLVVQDGNRVRTITLKDNRLYVLRKGDQWGRGELDISVPKGFAAYAFTFG
jgi:thiol-disulfide isomerase/thioredoxin